MFSLYLMKYRLHNNARRKNIVAMNTDNNFCQTMLCVLNFSKISLETKVIIHNAHIKQVKLNIQEAIICFDDFFFLFILIYRLI